MVFVSGFGVSADETQPPAADPTVYNVASIVPVVLYAHARAAGVGARPAVLWVEWRGADAFQTQQRRAVQVVMRFGRGAVRAEDCEAFETFAPAEVGAGTGDWASGWVVAGWTTRLVPLDFVLFSLAVQTSDCSADCAQVFRLPAEIVPLLLGQPERKCGRVHNVLADTSIEEPAPDWRVCLLAADAFQHGGLRVREEDVSGTVCAFLACHVSAA